MPIPTRRAGSGQEFGSEPKTSSISILAISHPLKRRVARRNNRRCRDDFPDCYGVNSGEVHRPQKHLGSGANPATAEFQGSTWQGDPNMLLMSVTAQNSQPIYL